MNQAQLHHTTPAYCTLAEFATHIHTAGLWGSKKPSRATLYRWLRAGLIIRRPGIRGHMMVDTAASLAKLRNPWALPGKN